MLWDAWTRYDCKSISHAINKGGNITSCFILTGLAKEYLAKAADNDATET
jgi:hypothetical protein